MLCGLSAGSLCWFAEAVTAFHGRPQRVDGLGLLPWSNCVHYDGEPERRVEYHRFVGDGMRGGYAADDGAALHFAGTDLRDVVTSRRGRRAYRVDVDGARGRRDAARGALPGARRAGAERGVSATRTLLALGGGGFTSSPR